MAELLRSGIGAGSVRLGSIGFALLLSVMLARGLGPVQFGEYAFVTTLIYVLSLPIGHALMQLVTRETALAVHIGDGARLAGLMRWGRQRVGVFTAAVVVLISIVALPRATWDPADRWTLLVFAAPALPFIGAIALRAGVLAGLKRVVAAQIAELLVRPVTQLTLVSVALVAGMLNGSVAAIAYTLAAIAGFAMVTLLGRQTRQALPGGAALPKTDSRWSHAWLPFVLLSAAGALNAQLGVLMLGWLASSDQVGAMQIAEQGSRLVALSLTIVNMVIGPYVVRAWQNDDLDQLQALSRRSARLALLASLPVALPLVLLAGPIVRLTFGADYVALAAVPLVILAGAQLVNVAFGSVGLLLTMSGHEHDALFGLAAGLVLNAVAAALLIPPYGATGAAAASALGLVAWNMLLAIRVYRRIRLRPGAL
jgi:O-antigen/teichoic acid export membrane protein